MGAANRTLRRAVTAGVLFGLVGSASAYACSWDGKKQTRLFSNDDQSLYGAVTGSVANCYSEAYVCDPRCTFVWDSKCNPCYRDALDKPAKTIVAAALARVLSADFHEVEATPAWPGLRLPNPQIESEAWVTITVNQYNLSGTLAPAVADLFGRF